MRITSRWWIQGGVLAAMVVASACGGAPDAPAPGAQPQEPIFKPIDPAALPAAGGGSPSSAQGAPGGAASAVPTAMVTDLASGWPISLQVGQEVTMRLGGDRAAGGRWSLRAGSDAGIVALQGEPAYETPPTGGVEVFRLRAVKPGTTTVTFDYKVGSSATAVRSASYPISVR